MGKTKIRALILDYGGVISEPQNSANVNNILQILKPDDGNFIEIYQSKRENYDNGQISGEAYWASVLRHYGLEPDSSQIARLIQEDVKSWTHINDAMTRFIEESRRKIYKLAIISNMTTDSLVFIRARFQWLALFDELIFSCDFGVNKPDARIYEACIRELELPPHECLFVDDSIENVNGAIQLGMNAVHFKSFPEFLSELDKKYYLSQ